MKKEITVNELLGINTALKMLVNKSITGIEAFKINKLIEGIKSEVTAFYGARDKIVKKHQKDDKGLKLGTKEYDIAIKEIEPIINEKTEFEYECFSMSLLERITLKENEGELLNNIMFMFKE